MISPFSDDWDTFVPSLKPSAPALRSLQLAIMQPGLYGAEEERCILPHSVLSGQPHQLRSVLLRGIQLPATGCPAFSALVVFDYRPPTATITAREVCNILSQMPQLETLGLEMCTFRADNQTVDMAHRCLRQVALVLSVELESSDELIFDPVSFFQHF